MPSYYARTETTGNGVQTTFTFSWDSDNGHYISETDVKVQVDGIDYTDFTVDGNSVTLADAPANGADVVIFRQTSLSVIQLFTRMGTPTSEAFNTTMRRVQYVAQELLDIGAATLTAGVSALMAERWAQETGNDVTGASAGDRSAKSWAQENLAGVTYGGSAKDWAQSGSAPDGTNLSAKSYALLAGTSATNAATSASAANTSALAAAASAAEAEAIAEGVLTTKGDLPVFGTTLERLGVGSNNQVLTADSAQTQGLKWSAVPYPKGHIHGLVLSNNATDADHDIDFTAGQVRSEDDTLNLSLGAMTKRFDASWASGTGNGGFASGESLPTSGTVHIWAISKADGTCDIMANNHATSGLSPTLPTDYTVKRRIASIRTDSSANFLGFVQDGDRFQYKTPILDVDVLNPGTSAVTRTVSTPTGLVLGALVGVMASSTDATGSLYVSSLDQTDVAPTLTAASSVYYNQTTSTPNVQHFNIKTNTSNQFRSRNQTSSANTSVRIITYGWEDKRGRLA